MRDRSPLLIGLALLALAVFLGSIAIGHGIRDRGNTNIVTVTGSAKAHITSDYAIWDLSVTSKQSQAAGAAKQLGHWTTAIDAFMTGRAAT